MRKIPTIFLRDEKNPSRVTDLPNPNCRWVFDADRLPIPTRKWDGTACLMRDRRLYARYDAKAGRTPPPGFEAAQEQPDPKSSHWPGWIPVDDSPAFRWHREALEGYGPDHFPNGTYELCGPKVQGNPEGQARHELIPHGEAKSLRFLVTYASCREFLQDHTWEGIVFYHPDAGDFRDDECRRPNLMAKIKRRDFGIPWPVPR